MFEIGWSEIIIIVIIACIMLEVKDIPKIFKIMRQVIDYCNDLIKEFKQVFNSLSEETKIVTDLEGKEHTAYDLPEIDKNEKSNKKNG